MNNDSLKGSKLGDLYASKYQIGEEETWFNTMTALTLSLPHYVKELHRRISLIVVALKEFLQLEIVGTQTWVVGS